MIIFNNVKYIYKTYEKKEGFIGAITDFIKRKPINVVAVNDVSFKIKSGEKVALLGPNGAGKSTIIKMLVGILQQQNGQIDINGMIPSRRKKEFLKSIGVIFGQKSQLIWDLPAIDTLRMLKTIYEINDNDFNERVNNMVVMLDLDEKLNIPVRKLSLGERMKFEIICSLIHNPRLLLLDEPTIGLDITSQRKIYDFLNEINKNNGITILLTSHYVRDVEELCDRVLILKKGCLVIDTLAKDLLNKYKITSSYIVEVLPERMSKIINFQNFKLIKENCFEISLTNDENIEDIIHNNGLNLNDILSFHIQQSNLEDILYDIYNKEDL